jgi:PAS domain S-box-containing protein
MEHIKKSTFEQDTLESLQADLDRLYSIYDTISDFIFDLSVEGEGRYRFKFVNQAFSEITGMNKSEILELGPEAIIPADNLQSVLDNYHQAIKTKKPVKWEEMTESPEGIMIGEITVVPVLNENGNCTNLVGSYHDITERKHSEELLRLSEEKWRTFVTKSPDGIVITTIEGILEEMSPTSLKMFGYGHPEEGIGKKLFEFIDPSCIDNAKQLMTKILQGEIVGAEEFIGIKKDGTHFFIEVNSEVIRNSEGAPIHFINNIRDITKRKTIEKALIERESELHRLAQAIRSISECVCITDMSDKIIFVNSAFLKTYQYEEHELIGNPISIVRSSVNSVDFVSEILPATLHGGWHGELINRRKDGSEFPVYVSTSVIQDENGNPLGLIGVTTDITDRKRAEQVLHESETRNKALLSAIPDLMFMFNKNGVFIDFHVQNPKMLLLEPELFLGKRIDEVLPQELADETMNHLNEVFVTGKTSVYEYSIKIGNDTWMYESRIVPCGKDSALSIVRDITDQKKMESQMIQSERLAALGEMSAGMAHEINQPLNTLSILFDNILFEAKENHSVSEEYLVSKSEKIFNNILRIKNIIDHVREFSRSQEGEIQTPFNINESILNAISMVSEQYKMAGIELIADLSGNLPMIKGNTYKFERIILNLIINSKDALLEKRNEFHEAYPMNLKITTRYDKQFICVEVEDNGIGIKGDQIDKVLQPFYTTKGTGKGTGLGLSISYGLIREMNGRIDIKSKEKKGTTITITIPL